MSNKIDLQGKVFGRLKVISEAGFIQKIPKSKLVLWLCECSCGSQVIVKAVCLRYGKTKSCGCLQREWAVIAGKNSKKEGTALRALYARFKYQAIKRNLEFKLTIEQVENLISKECYYCAVKPNNYLSVHKVSNLIYSGIDRRNNSKGYTVENCVASCWGCNRMKGSMSEDEFISHCKKIARYA